MYTISSFCFSEILIFPPILLHYFFHILAGIYSFQYDTLFFFELYINVPYYFLLFTYYMSFKIRLSFCIKIT